jgi:2-polyprenyl-3-methyl-5-hydroxy-6-metoxy-1,4-benzoquinol methylase
MNRRDHWSGVYRSKAPDAVSWYQERPALSLAMIARAGAGKVARLIDVGAGSSTLVDYLLDDGWRDITLLDVSAGALETVRTRLGDRAALVSLVEADITAVTLPSGAYDVWHDRAVFHFLTDPAARRAYVDAALHAVAPAGGLIVATFALDGPEQCSGLPVARYDAASLAAEFAPGFELVETAGETHVTPWSSEQRFVYCRFRRAAPV